MYYAQLNDAQTAAFGQISRARSPGGRSQAFPTAESLMPQVVAKSRWVPHPRLELLAAQLFEAAQVPRDDAELAARILVEANLRGVDSHGVARAPHYLRRIRRGSINPRPRMVVSHLGASSACVDGDHGLGHLVMHRAAEEAACLARKSGAAWVTVRNSSHCGALAYYGQQIAAAGMIGLVFTHVDSMVLPYRAKQPFCGTNPLCICVPTRAVEDAPYERPAVCLDMATSRVPWNTVANAAMEGVAIAQSWAVDSEGRATTNAEQARALLPLGSYKGSGLGLMIDILCSLLSGAPYGPDITRMYGDLGEQRRLGGLVGAIDISRFVELDEFCRRLNEMLVRWGALSPVEPGTKVLYPGEPEHLIRSERLRTGIPIGLHLLDELNELACSHQLAPLPSEPNPGAGVPPPHFVERAARRDSEPTP
jgi:ureidoglycolate dehydrogenase (NAD+)